MWFDNCAYGSATGWVGFRWPWPKPALWQACFLTEAWFFHQGNVGRDGLMVAVNLNQWNTAKKEWLNRDHWFFTPSKVSQLVDVDIAPLILCKSCDIAKRGAFIRVILHQIPFTRSKGIKQLHNEKRCVFKFLRVKRVIAHCFGNDGNKFCFFHMGKG